MSDAPAASAAHVLGAVASRTGQPVRAMIEISDRCNEVCVHCYQEQGQKGEMSTAQVKKVMDDLAELGVLMLTLSGGEATLRKDFLELVEHARGCGFAVTVYTNGLTMTPELARRLVELAVFEVEVSLYAPDAATHDFVTGVKGSFERSTGAIRALVTAGMRVQAKTNVFSFNADRVEAYKALCLELGCTPRFDTGSLMAREGGDRAPSLLNLRPEQRRTGLRQGSLPGVAPSGTRLERLDLAPCGAGRTPVVEPNGEVRPCTMLELNLGDAREGTVREATESEPNRRLTALSWEQLHGCRSCDINGACHRCYALALAEVGDALAPYPSACGEARALYERNVGRELEFVGERSSAVGPYRELSPGRLEPFEQAVTDADRALVQQQPWLRGPAAPTPEAPVCGSAPAPGDLVQIRRPGGRTRMERIPEVPALRGASASRHELNSERPSGLEARPVEDM